MSQSSEYRSDRVPNWALQQLDAVMRDLRDYALEHPEIASDVLAFTAHTTAWKRVFVLDLRDHGLMP